MLRLPKLIVFDLDACLWTPEMFQLRGMPMEEQIGSLNGKGEGIVGVKVPGKRGQTVELFPGALSVLQELVLDEKWKEVKLALASSSLEPSYSYKCLEKLEVLPGVKMGSIFHSTSAIGREGELTPDKKTHFTVIHRELQIPFEEMLFFDDCIWGDSVGRVQSVFGVLGVRTPEGLTVDHFQKGLQLFHEVRSANNN